MSVVRDMGALDTKAFSGTAALAALMFVISASLVVVGDGPLADNSTVKYMLLIAGVATLVYSVSLIWKGDCFVRRLQGITMLIAGVLFAASCFTDSAEALIASAGVLAFVTSFFAFLTYWLYHTYGAMYVSAILAAIQAAAGVYLLTKDFEPLLAGVMIFAVSASLIIDFVVAPYFSKGAEKKTREVIDSARSVKQEKAQAKNRKATPKAKKAAPKAGSAVVGSEDAPVEKKTVQKAPVVAPAVSEPVEESKSVEDKKEQKRPDKATGEFMEKLMRSQDANRAAKKAEDAPAERPVRTVALPKSDALDAQKRKVEAVQSETPVEEVVQQAVEVEIEAPAADIPVVEETPAEEPVQPDVPVEEQPEPVPETSVISEPIGSRSEEYEFQSKEPNWGDVVKDSSLVSEEPESAPREIQVMDVEVEQPEQVQEVSDAAVEETPAEEAVEIVEDQVAAEPEVPVEEQPEPVTEAPVEETPAEESVQPEAPVEEPAQEISEQTVPETVAEEVPVETVVDASNASPEVQEPAEDIYTDNSPEALVRRAAWNKGLRCRRGYGEHEIPVAFVKGKVAVYVTDAGADASIDDVLREEGWTVLRYDAASITDGKQQGEEIAAAVKANTKTVKKKSRR